jgi:hypothetical protein
MFKVIKKNAGIGISGCAEFTFSFINTAVAPAERLL